MTLMPQDEICVGVEGIIKSYEEQGLFIQWLTFCPEHR